MIDQRVSGIKNSKNISVDPKKTEQLSGSKLQIIIAFFYHFGWLCGNKILFLFRYFVYGFLYKFQKKNEKSN